MRENKFWVTLNDRITIIVVARRHINQLLFNLSTTNLLNFIGNVSYVFFFSFFFWFRETLTHHRYGLHRSS